MPETPADQSKELSYYRNFKDAHIIILQEVEGTNASYAISVYSALNWIANDQGDQFRAFSESIGLIAYHAGLAKRKTSAVLKILSAITLLTKNNDEGIYEMFRPNSNLKILEKLEIPSLGGR